MSNSLTSVETALLAFDPDEKIALLNGIVAMAPMPISPEPRRLAEPGRPPKPILISPKEVPKRGLGSIEGRAALLHALAHIEFNAVNLALDAIYRFREMPLAYYEDWLQVAKEEALHFTLLRDYLQKSGFDYGDFPAHNGLWDMALRTDHDVMVRMALVPRILEARGLDVTPGIRAKLWSVGDRQAAKILDVILRDEIGHVQIGNRWYHWCCEQRGLEPVATFVSLLRDYAVPAYPGALNHAARREAGFSDEELALIESLQS
ncbi:ferritin-like domain-containing protein [Silvimonas soli]|uniref:ferritin-like domain-containing protein n=1 Tax=Silvimonas soli TaxID=2980100 RepID=UPI0024B3A827|nr:ferritin-like domain-containing protein [Silvimonas soli]